MKLHLGCGKERVDGFVRVDISPDVGADIVADLEKPLPFKDNSIDGIVANHVLEHIKNLMPLFEELYRICMNGTRIKIRVPYFSHESAFSTITHVRFFSYTSFDMLDKKHICAWQGVGNFRTISKKLKWRPNIFFFFNWFPKIYQNFFCWIFPAKELQVELEVVKT